MWSRTSKQCIGLALHRDGLVATEAERSAHGMRATWARRFETGPCFDATGALRPEALGPALSGVAEHVGRRFLPLRVALPDPLVTMRVFELDALPAGYRARQDLAAWRMARDLDTRTEALVCTHQYLGEDTGRHLLLVVGVPGALMAGLGGSLKAAGVFAVHADAAAAHRFNATAARHEAHQAWLVLEADYWTLSISDEQSRLRHLRSRWRTPGGSLQEEMREVSEETERALLAYGQGNAARQVACLQVTGAEAERNALSEQLSGRPWAAFEFPAAEAAGVECGSFASVAAAIWQ